MKNPPVSNGLTVTVAYAAHGVEALVTLTLPGGATIDDAIAASGIATRLELDAAQLQCAIFGHRASGDTPLAEGDRVELTRPLTADPKRARRLRAAGRIRSKPDPNAGERN